MEGRAADAEVLDIERPAELERYLRSRGRIGAGERVRIEVLAGGVSNRTVLVERSGGPAWVVKQALPKLRVPVDWFSAPERIHREALGLRCLPSLTPEGTIPALVFEELPCHVLAMEAVPRPHENWKTVLLAGRVDLALVEAFGDLLARIHRGGLELPEETRGELSDRSYFESLRLEPYYGFTAERVLEAGDFLGSLRSTTRERALTLVHGDYSPKNVLVHQGRLVLLDHEVIHLGDPGFDCGFALTHLLSKGHHLPAARPVFARAARLFWRTYRRGIAGTPLEGEAEERAALHTLACLLARVEGRSLLEYLDAPARRRQREAVLALLPRVPSSVPALVEAFLERVE